MSTRERFLVTCPDCGGQITVDATTGEVLAHRASPQKAKPATKDFDALLKGLDDSKQRAEEIFEQEFSAFKDRDRLLEAKFQEALKRAEEDPDEGPPARPWDLE